MLVTATGLMFLEARKGEFTPKDSKDSIHYQNATFFQKDGGTFTLKVDKQFDVDDFVPTHYYDATIDFTEISYGRSKAFSGRLVDYSESYGE